MPHVLLLVPTRTYRASDFLAASRDMGVSVTVGTERDQALAEETPGGTLTLDFQDREGALQRILDLHRRQPLDAVVGVDDEALGVAGEAAASLGFPGNPVDAVENAGDKYRTRQRLAAAGLPVPEFRVIPRDQDPSGIASDIPYPVVLKPTFLSASRGVIRADHPEEFVAAFRRIASILEDPEVSRRGGPRARSILVESFLTGVEVALEGLLVGGRLEPLALFDKPDPMDGPYFEETLYVTPSRLPQPMQLHLWQTVEQAVAALGLEEGPIHAEVRLSGTTPYVLEIAARSIGGRCSRALRFGAGISLEEIILNHALHRDVGLPVPRNGAAGVLMLPIPNAGILHRVDHIEEARSIPGLVDVDITIPRGQKVVPLPEGDRYLGFLIAQAATPKEVETSLRRAHETLTIHIT